jgi:hypothetical protein
MLNYLTESGAREATGLNITHVFFEKDNDYKYVEDNAFKNPKGSVDNYALHGVYLPKGIKSIGVSSFEYLLNAKVVTLPEGLETIGESAFRGPSTGKNTIEITSFPSTLKSIGEEAFYRNDGISITSIPKGVIELPYRCFYNCANVRVDTFGSAEGESLMTIGEDCFRNAGSAVTAINRIYLH